VSGQGKGHAAPPTAARLEDRLLRSPLGPVYRLAVAAAARALLAYVTHAPSWAPRHIVWERIGYRFVFPRGYVMVARTAFGAAITCSMKDLIQRHILFFGVWEPNLTEFLRRRLMPGDTFIELGANVGYFTLLASQRVGENGAVVAVEAAPDIFRQLQDNLARNAARNVRAVPIAVAAAAGTVRLFADHRGNLGATTTIRNSQARRFDALFLRQGGRSRCHVVRLPRPGRGHYGGRRAKRSKGKGRVKFSCDLA